MYTIMFKCGAFVTDQGDIQDRNGSYNSRKNTLKLH